MVQLIPTLYNCYYVVDPEPDLQPRFTLFVRHFVSH